MKFELLESDGFRNGEASDSIYKWFGERLDSGAIVWEPFASNTNHRTGKLLPNQKIIAFSLGSSDNLVQNRDSRTNNPGIQVDAVFFHPPYWGSKFSGDGRDLSNLNFYGWLDGLCKVIVNIDSVLKQNGKICVVGGAYRYKGEEQRMDLLFASLFSLQFINTEFCHCPPDIAMIFKRKPRHE